MQLNVDDQYLIETLQHLVGINSINPMLVSAAPGEEEIGKFLAQELNRLKINTEIDELAAGRVNVVGIRKGSGGGRSLMLNAHTDTVGIDKMEDPFSAVIKEGRLYGRGAQDMKGSIAAILAMLKMLADEDIHHKGDLIVAFVADEEYGSIGTERLLMRYHADAAIVAEPTNLDICIAHKGFGVFEFTTAGKAAHGSRPQEGIDANIRMGRILAELEQLSQKTENTKPHPYLGTSSLHVPLINGGSQLFIYADECKIQVEKRTLPGESREKILTQFNTIINKLAKADESFHAAVKPVLWRNPYEISKIKEIVSVLQNSVVHVLGFEPSYIGHSWWEDSGLIGAAGIDTVIIGPKGDGLHSSKEWVDIQSVRDLAAVLFDVVVRYCGQ